MSGEITPGLQEALRKCTTDDDVRLLYRVLFGSFERTFNSQECTSHPLYTVWLEYVNRNFVEAIQKELGAPRSEYFRFSLPYCRWGIFMEHYCETVPGEPKGCIHTLRYQWDTKMLDDRYLIRDVYNLKYGHLQGGNGDCLRGVVRSRKDYVTEHPTSFWKAKELLLSDGEKEVNVFEWLFAPYGELRSLRSRKHHDEYPIRIRFKDSGFNVEIRIALGEEKVHIRHGDNYAKFLLRINMHLDEKHQEDPTKYKKKDDFRKTIAEFIVDPRTDEIKERFAEVANDTQDACLDRALAIYPGAFSGYHFSCPPFLRLANVTYKRLYTREVPEERYLGEAYIEQDMLLQSLCYAVGNGTTAEVISKFQGLKEIHLVAGWRKKYKDGKAAADGIKSVLNEDAVWWSSDDKEEDYTKGTVVYVALYAGKDGQIAFNCLREHSCKRVRSHPYMKKSQKAAELSLSCKRVPEITKLKDFVDKREKRKEGKSHESLEEDLADVVQGHLNELLKDWRIVAPLDTEW